MCSWLFVQIFGLVFFLSYIPGGGWIWSSVPWENASDFSRNMMGRNSVQC